jgi:toxin HigB-1
MIRSFGCKNTKQLFELRKNKRWSSIAAVALRKLDQIDISLSVEQLRVPPGNRLEMLEGDRADQWSIRINDQFRICFSWDGEDAIDVEIVDYQD